MICNYYSNGKLLLTGEYLVLQGAQALALPVGYGQSMAVESNINNVNIWNSYVEGKLWLKITFDNKLKLIAANNLPKAKKLLHLLKQARKINPAFLNKNYFDIKTNLNFNKLWGLGSSSTLISNIAYWAGIDPFELFFRTESGSGYDIACARSDKPLLYQIKNNNYDFQQINFNPPFRKNLYFIYLGKKQSTNREVARFNRRSGVDLKSVNKISELTRIMAKTKSINVFLKSIREHEDIISQSIGMAKIKDKHFTDFEGEIKSLGAWGGDFVLACSRMGSKNIIKYFKQKKFPTIIPYNDIVIKKDRKNFEVFKY